MDIFAPGPKYNTSFIVQNISTQIKTIKIFNYPIPYLQERDLLAIDGISEANIRASLLKGELNYKLRAQDIVIIYSDMDLLQFNNDQYNFLQQSGVNAGTQTAYQQYNTLQLQDVQLVGDINGVNTTFMIPVGVWLQHYPYNLIVYKNGVKQVLDDDYFIYESGGSGSGYDTCVMTIPPNISNGIADVMTADYYIDNT